MLPSSSTHFSHIPWSRPSIRQSWPVPKRRQSRFFVHSKRGHSENQKGPLANSGGKGQYGPSGCRTVEAALPDDHSVSRISRADGADMRVRLAGGAVIVALRALSVDPRQRDPGSYRPEPEGSSPCLE